jgi:hypothetical protein
MSTRSVFMFSFREHEWMTDVEGEEEFDLMASQFIQQGTWTWVEAKTQGEIDRYCDDATERYADFAGRVRESLEEMNVPEELAKVPFDKLEELMGRDGWTFAGGTFYEFEGNHNDTEIFVVLKKIGT